MTNEEIDKILEYQNKFKTKKPIEIEMENLFNSVFPYDKLHTIFKLGQAYIISILKNDCFENFDKYGKETIDYIIDSSDEELKGFYDKLLKPKKDKITDILKENK